MNIPVFFASNEFYIPYVSVMMQSIMENAAKGRKYEFYILYIDIKNETMEILKKQVSLFPDFSLNFFDVSQYVKGYDFFVSRHITVEAYFRLFIPYIFPNLEKTLYFDGDMVCLTDISQLFDTDISNYLVGGVRDYSGLSTYYSSKWKRKRKWAKVEEVLLSMEHPENYINSGMLLINCEKFRKTHTIQYILDIICSRKWQSHDQDVINVLAKDKILYFDYEWNYSPYPAPFVKYFPEIHRNKYIETKKNPKIIHSNPYSCWWYIPHFEFFWKYATRTPFVNDIIARMNKNGIIEKINLKDKLFTKAQEKICSVLRNIFRLKTKRFIYP